MQKFMRSVVRWRSNNNQKLKRQCIDVLPHEIILTIIEFLNYDVHDIAALSRVNKNLRYHTKDNLLWYKLCLKHFPDSLLELSKLIKIEQQDGQTKDWMKIFGNLYWKHHKIIFAEKFEAKELISYGWIPKFGQFSDIKIDHTHPNLVRAIQESFDIDVSFESISPGIYEIIWEMNVYNLQKAQRFQFITKIFHQNYDLSNTNEHSPPPEAFKKLSDKGWFKCRMPTKIVIEQNQIVSVRFIGHAKMCHSNPQDWPAPMALYCVYLKRYKSKNETKRNKSLCRIRFMNRFLHR